MSQEQIERLCMEAMQRITYFINRCAGQHLRAMRANKPAPEPQSRPTPTQPQQRT